MSATPLKGAEAPLSQLCIHSITTKPWRLDESIPAFARAGVKGITVWRDALAATGIPQARKLASDHGLQVVSLCRGGFFPGRTAEERQSAIDDNRRAIADAHALGTDLVVLVCGAVPGLPLNDARSQIRDGIAALLGDCEAARVRLAVEPLHPMYADSRSAINTLRQANDLCEQLASPFVGVAYDVYHLWWDPELESETARCGRLGKLFAYHVCDWRTPTTDLLNDRGLMGEGCIPLRKIRSWVERAGFSCWSEVEIFSTRLWQQDQQAFLKQILHAYKQHV
jgi:sugar phosphate isomerase/epimerase